VDQADFIASLQKGISTPVRLPIEPIGAVNMYGGTVCTVTRSQLSRRKINLNRIYIDLVMNSTMGYGA
jgi:hypothetical protein